MLSWYFECLPIFLLRKIAKVRLLQIPIHSHRIGSLKRMTIERII
jgi:hypothetical protein